MKRETIDRRDAGGSRSSLCALRFSILLGLVLLSAVACYALDPWGWRSEAPFDAARFHLQQAQQALDDRDLELAREHLQHCLEAAPLSAEAHFLRAQTCRRLDDPTGWAAHLRKAGILGWPVKEIEMEARLKEAQTGNTWNVEEGLVDELNAKTPQQALILEALVKGYLENDRAKDAYRLSDEWVHDHPGDWQARLYRGRAAQLGVYFQQAITDYQYVLQVKPDQPQAQLWLANTFVSDRQYPQALEHFQAYLRRHPESADAMLGLANCQFSLGEVEAAQTTLDQLLAKNKDYTAGLLLRAQVEQAESPEKALPWLYRAVATAPNDPQVLQPLVLVLHQLGRQAEAEKYDQRLKDRDPKIKELIKLQTRAIQENDNLDLRFQIGKLHLELGDEDEAAHWFQTILWIDPTHRPTYRALADYWQKRGNVSRARHYRYLAEGKTPPDMAESSSLTSPASEDSTSP